MNLVLRMDPVTIKKLKTGVKDTDLYNVNSPDLLEKTYIFTSKEALDIQFQPWLTSNAGLGTLALKASELFFKVFFDHQKSDLEKIDPESFCDVVPLSGSLYYHMSDAFYNVFHRALPQVFLGVRSQLINCSF